VAVMDIGLTLGLAHAGPAKTIDNRQRRRR
jgi:hypothetical protein